MTSNEQRGLDAATNVLLLKAHTLSARELAESAIAAYLEATAASQVAPNADLVGLMAHQITGAINGNCCHRTGGLVDIHTCECRDAAERILEAFPGIETFLRD